MFCPECHSEFQPGVTFCANCKVQLVSQRPEDDIFGSPEGMATALGDEELEVIVVGNHVALLEAQRELARHRIPSVIAGEEEPQVEAALHARFYLMVRPTQLDEARGVFAARWKQGLEKEGLTLATSAGKDDGACPACGAAIADTASECGECGLVVG